MGSGVAADFDALADRRINHGPSICHQCSGGGSRVFQFLVIADQVCEGSDGKLGPLSPFLPCSLLSIFFPRIPQTS